MKEKNVSSSEVPFEKWFEHGGNALEMEIRDYEGYR